MALLSELFQTSTKRTKVISQWMKRNLITWRVRVSVWVVKSTRNGYTTGWRIFFVFYGQLWSTESGKKPEHREQPTTQEWRYTNRFPSSQISCLFCLFVNSYSVPMELDIVMLSGVGGGEGLETDANKKKFFFFHERTWRFVAIRFRFFDGVSLSCSTVTTISYGRDLRESRTNNQ